MDFYEYPDLVEGANNVYTMPECPSTNTYVKENFAQFAPLAAIFTTSQTAGRGRLGRVWENAKREGFYYTIAIAEALVQPSTLPLLASLAVVDVLQKYYDINCEIKWPNDILYKGKKIAGILCESVNYGLDGGARGIICGIGINLAQTQQYFEDNNLPHGTSVTTIGKKVDIKKDAEELACMLTSFGFDRPLYTFARSGFAPYIEKYKNLCVNIGKEVKFPQNGGKEGTGIVKDIDVHGQLIVQTAEGEAKVFTGEVTVKGIY